MAWRALTSLRWSCSRSRHCRRRSFEALASLPPPLRAEVQDLGCLGKLFARGDLRVGSRGTHQVGKLFITTLKRFRNLSRGSGSPSGAPSHASASCPAFWGCAVTPCSTFPPPGVPPSGVSFGGNLSARSAAFAGLPRGPGASGRAGSPVRRAGPPCGSLSGGSRFAPPCLPLLPRRPLLPVALRRSRPQASRLCPLPLRRRWSLLSP